MVHTKLVNTYKPGHKESESLGETISSLRIIALHDHIREICEEVISAVEMSLLVYVDPKKIETRRPRKERFVPMKYPDHEVHKSTQLLRTDWSSHLWEVDPPHGWVYYNDDHRETVLGVIYRSSPGNETKVLIQKAIADNPDGAVILIRAMKERLLSPLSKNPS